MCAVFRPHSALSKTRELRGKGDLQLERRPEQGGTTDHAHVPLVKSKLQRQDTLTLRLENLTEVHNDRQEDCKRGVMATNRHSTRVA